MTTNPRTVAPGRTAYLVSQYPALSHVFVESEVAALRQLGWHVQTFSVRGTDLPRHAEAAGTVALRTGGVAAVVAAVMTLLRRQPVALTSGLRAALRWGAGRSAKQRLWQFFYLAQALVLHRHMEARGLRHVHVHFANNGADIARLAVTIGRAVEGSNAWTWSLAVHGPTEFENASAYGLAGKVESASFVACITDFCRSQVMRHVRPVLWGRLQVVRMGVPASVARGAGPEEPPAGSPLRVLFVGRAVPEKGPHVLLDAVDEMARTWADAGRTGPIVDVVFVGAGPLLPSMEARAAGLHHGVAVRFLGGLPHEQLLPWYTWAQAFCLPSFSEGLPVVLMEAMAHRLPVVTTPIAGIPELVVHHDTGVLAAPGRSDDLAIALRALADSADLRRGLGQRGHDAVRSRHDARTNGILLAGLLARATTEGR